MDLNFLTSFPGDLTNVSHLCSNSHQISGQRGQGVDVGPTFPVLSSTLAVAGEGAFTELPLDAALRAWLPFQDGGPEFTLTPRWSWLREASGGCRVTEQTLQHLG
jgi:hypothetical protein